MAENLEISPNEMNFCRNWNRQQILKFSQNTKVRQRYSCKEGEEVSVGTPICTMEVDANFK